MSEFKKREPCFFLGIKTSEAFNLALIRRIGALYLAIIAILAVFDRIGEEALKIRVIEHLGEVKQIGDNINYEFRIALKDFSPEIFFRERDKAFKKYYKMKRKIISNVLQKVS